MAVEANRDGPHASSMKQVVEAWLIRKEIRIYAVYYY